MCLPTASRLRLFRPINMGGPLTEATHAFFKLDSKVKLADLTGADDVKALEAERQRAADEREQARIEIARHEQYAHAKARGKTARQAY